jgi:hypothetical protein
VSGVGRHTTAGFDPDLPIASLASQQPLAPDAGGQGFMLVDDVGVSRNIFKLKPMVAKVNAAKIKNILDFRFATNYIHLFLAAHLLLTNHLYWQGWGDFSQGKRREALVIRLGGANRQDQLASLAGK